MELQFKKSDVRCMNWAAREVQNTELTQELRLPDGMPDIGRILGSWGQVILRSKEWLGDQMTLTGGVMVWVLYAPEDGTEPRSMDAWMPFQLKWKLQDCDREGPIRIHALLRCVDGRTVSARKMMIRAGVSAMGEAMYPVELAVYQPEEVPEDVELLRSSYPVTLSKEAGEKTFLLDEDLSLPGNVPQVEKILAYTVNPEITEQKIMADKVVWKGNGNLHLLYRCPEGRVHTWDFDLPFSQFQDLDTAYDNEAWVDLCMGTTSLELDKGDEGKLRLKCGLVAQYLIYERELIEVVQDGYSPNRCVELKMETLDVPALLDRKQEMIQAEQSLNGVCGEMVDLQFLPDFPIQYRCDDNVELELPGIFQYLCYGEDGALQGGSARWNGEYCLKAGADCCMNVIVNPVGHTTVLESGDRQELRGQLELTTQCTSKEGIPMVTGLEIGDIQEADPARPSLILRKCGNTKLWDIAKETGSTVSAIQKANHLENDPDEGQVLLIPVS